MRVGAKAFARSYPVVVQYTQGAEVHATGIVILVKTECMMLSSQSYKERPRLSALSITFS